MNAAYLKSKFEASLGWEAYLATDGEKAANWRSCYDQARLSEEQRKLVKGFVRRMNVLCISGIWCGDCVQQGPLIQRIAEANSLCKLGFLDRDEHLDLAEQVKINAGLRVPVVLFAAEDFEPVSIYGDRTLSRYRALAAKQLGASCPLPGAAVEPKELDAMLADWLDEFERVHLLLRLSARLREKHGD